MSVWFNRPRASTGGTGTGTTPIHPPTPMHRLTVREKLELSPWAKWSLYGYFPWKMSLHVTLVVLITLQATLVNMHYAAYSRAVGRSFINLFFPPTHASPDVGEFSYHIFDVRDTISDAHRLLETYFRLPELSVDAVKVATPNPPFPYSSSSSTPPEPQEQKDHASIRLPQITLSYHNPSKLPDVFLLPNASAAWPFQVNGPVQQWLEGANGGLPEMRSFLDDLKKIDFDFRVRSKGWGGGVDRSREVCVLWSLGFVYDLSVGGQFSVGMVYRPESRCSPLGVGDRYIVLCSLIGLVSAVYQLLLFRSAWERFKILRYLKRRTETPCNSQHGPGGQGEGGREGGREEEDRPRHPSAFSTPVRSSGGGREEGEGEGEEGKEVEGERLPLLASGATAARRSSAAGGGDGGRGAAAAAEGGGYQSMAPSHRPHLSTFSSSSSTSSSTPSSRILLLHPLPSPRPTSPLPPSLPPLLITTTTTSKAYDALTWLDKLELFGLWPAVALLGNVCALTYTLQSLSSHTHVDIFVNPSLRLLLGLACLMLWLALIQYLEFESRYYVMILTLKRAVPRIGQFLLGIAPMFLGYALLGMILFGDQNPLFGSLVRTVGTLFCVVNGDSIKVVLDSLGGSGVGVLYVVVYMMLFTYIVLMTCIAIVEEAFFSSAEYAYSLWVGEEEEGEGGGKVQMFSPYENGAGKEQQDGGSYSSYHSTPPPSHPHEQQQQQQQQQQQHDGGEHDYIPVLRMAGVSYTSLSTSSAISASSSSSSRPPSPSHYPTPSSSTTSSSFLPNLPGLRSPQNSTGSASGAFEPVLTSSSSPLPPSLPPPPPPSYLPSRLTIPAPSPLNTGSSTHATPRSSSSSPALLPSLPPPPPPPPPPGQGMKRTPSGSRVISAKLRQLIHEADAAIAQGKGGEGGREGGYGFQPVMLGEVGRSQSASAPSSTMSFSASGGGGGGGREGGRGGGWDRRKKEEEESAQSQQQLNISEALNELQTLLLRQVARQGGGGGGGGEGRHVQTGGEGEDASAAIRQAIENTKHKLLSSPAVGAGAGAGAGGLRRDSREGGREGGRRTSSAGVLPTQREMEEEDGVGSIGSSGESGGDGEEKEEEGKKGRSSV